MISPPDKGVEADMAVLLDEDRAVALPLLYEQERQHRMRRAVKLGCVLGVILIPTFGLLDFLVAPGGSLLPLFVIRSVCSVNLLILFFLNRGPLGQRYAVQFAIYGAASVGVAIALMTHVLGGPKSPYFAGIMLTVIVVGILTPMNIWEGMITFLIMYLFYLLNAYPFLEGKAWISFYNNSFFILASMVVVLVGFHLKERWSRHDVERRLQLSEARRKLEEYTAGLEGHIQEQTQLVRALFRMANRLNALETLEDVLQTVTQAVHRYTNSGRVAILLRQGKEETLAYAHGTGVNASGMRGQPLLRMASPFLQEIIQRDRAVLIHGSQEGGRPEGLVALLGDEDWLGVGLRHRQEAFGIILAADRLPDGSYTKDEMGILTYIGDSATVALYNQLVSRRLRGSYLSTVQALTYAIEAKDPYTRGHSERVRNYALALAKRLRLSERETLLISYATILHDIGKVEISRDIIQKPDPLTEDEFTAIKDHPVFGEIMVEGIPFLDEVRPLIRHHHERWDGNGYPDGLLGEEIPLGARIILVADVYDALTLARPYHRGTSKERAILELRREKGRRLDPNLVEAFISMIQDMG